MTALMVQSGTFRVPRRRVRPGPVARANAGLLPRHSRHLRPVVGRAHRGGPFPPRARAVVERLGPPGLTHRPLEGGEIDRSTPTGSRARTGQTPRRRHPSLTELSSTGQAPVMKAVCLNCDSGTWASTTSSLRVFNAKGSNVTSFTLATARAAARRARW